jgi:hypothetical protein
MSTAEPANSTHTIDDEPWYAAKCVFLHKGFPVKPGSHVYEERILLVRAGSWEQAMDKATREAAEYVKGIDAQLVQVVDVYHLYETEIGDGAEVYSLMRTTPLEPPEFVRHYFLDGTEHCREID